MSVKRSLYGSRGSSSTKVASMTASRSVSRAIAARNGYRPARRWTDSSRHTRSSQLRGSILGTVKVALVILILMAPKADLTQPSLGGMFCLIGSPLARLQRGQYTPDGDTFTLCRCRRNKPTVVPTLPCPEALKPSVNDAHRHVDNCENTLIYKGSNNHHGRFKSPPRLFTLSQETGGGRCVGGACCGGFAGDTSEKNFGTGFTAPSH